MTELLQALRRLFAGSGRSVPPKAQKKLDRERAASMADEGGAAAAAVEAQPALARPIPAEPSEKRDE